MLGCYKYAWILSYLINWVKKLYYITRFFYTAFIATINPLYFYTAKKTLPNLPSPNFYTMSKLSILSSSCCIFCDE